MSGLYVHKYVTNFLIGLKDGLDGVGSIFLRFSPSFT
jgi:hypothetical protein